jgi:two-component system, OmpR family, response regulator VicR
MASVMVVDDEDVLVEMLAALVEDLGHHPIVAVNGREALAKLSSLDKAPSVIVVDIMMPQMNGLQFVEAVRSDPRYANIPIILMSAASSPKNVNGDTHFLAKPFDMQTLADLIEQCINEHTTI